jgi:hypothetical protein
MTIKAVLPDTNSILSSSMPTLPPRPNQISSTAVGAASFADTFRSRALSSGSVDLDAIFDAAGQKYNLSPNLLKAVAKVESNFRPDVTSRVGAMGIMQLMPGTARYLGVTDAFDPEQSIMGGARYLREQLDRFDGDVKLALAAYNAGWPAVKKHGGIPPFRETQAYVPKVLGYMGEGEITAGTLTYNGFEMNGKISETPVSNNSAFNFNEMLVQMLFTKIIDMQMNSIGGNNNSRVF